MNNNPPIIDTGDTSTPPAFAPDAQPQQFVAPEPEKKKGSIGTIIFAILFVIALAGAGFMFYMNMEANKQVDDLTKKNKDLTAQLAEKPEEDEDEEEPAKGDITGELLTEANGKYVISVSEFKNGADGVSEIMLMQLHARVEGSEGTSGFGRYYYRSEPGVEWQLIAEGQAAGGDCHFYDEGVAAAFGGNLPCVAPTADDQTDPAGEPTDETPSEEE